MADLHNIGIAPEAPESPSCRASVRKIPDAESGDYLHQCNRPVGEVEDHLFQARALSRALFLLVSGEDARGMVIEDARDTEALIALASEVAWQVSAAECAVHREHLSNEHLLNVPKA